MHKYIVGGIHSMVAETKTVALLQWFSCLFLRIRVKWRRHKRTQSTFVLSFLITYLLTIGLSVGSLLIQIEAKSVETESISESGATYVSELTSNSSLDETKNNSAQPDSQAPAFDFYDCSNINMTEFITAKLLETLVPTAITFSGTILILQSDATGKQRHMVLLFVVITFLVIGGIVLPTVKTPAFLRSYLWVLGILCIISIYLSWKVFSVAPVQSTNHKSEPSDGKIVF